MSFKTFVVWERLNWLSSNKRRLLGIRFHFQHFNLESGWLFLECVGYKGKAAKQCLFTKPQASRTTSPAGKKGSPLIPGESTVPSEGGCPLPVSDCFRAFPVCLLSLSSHPAFLLQIVCLCGVKWGVSSLFDGKHTKALGRSLERSRH